MRFPYKATDFKSVQKNFDYVQGFITNRILQAIVGLTGYSIQFGQFTSPALIVGNNVVTVPLATPWPTQHLMFLGIGQPNTTAFSLTSQYCGTNGLSNGFLHITSAVAQTSLVNWVSVGK